MPRVFLGVDIWFCLCGVGVLLLGYAALSGSYECMVAVVCLVESASTGWVGSRKE